MILQKNFAEREHFFCCSRSFCSIYVLFPRVLHEYGRITTVHERHVTEEVFMYSLWSNYVYIHRELWHHSKKPFLFQALEIVSQVLTGFFGILLPAGILLFLEQSSGFAGFALGTLVLFSLLCRCFCQPHLSAIAERLAVYRIPDRLFYAPPSLSFHADRLCGSDRAKNAAARRKSRRSHLQQLGRRGRHVPIRCHNLFFVSWADSLRRTDRNRPSGYHSLCCLCSRFCSFSATAARLLTKSAAETICLKLKYRSAISRNSRTTHPPERISVCIS